jgi:hypothetical protein
MDYTPNTALAVFFKDGAYIGRIGQIAPVGINHRRLFVGFCGVCWQGTPCESL